MGLPEERDASVSPEDNFIDNMPASSSIQPGGQLFPHHKYFIADNGRIKFHKKNSVADIGFNRMRAYIYEPTTSSHAFRIRASLILPPDLKFRQQIFQYLTNMLRFTSSHPTIQLDGCPGC
jgi:hypothetical protein